MHTVSLTHQLVAIQDDFDLDKIIESGQCFRPQKLSDGRYRFLSGGALLYLTPLGDGQYDAAWYGSDREYWADYFDLGRNYAALRCSLAGQSSYLDKSLDFGQGIRVLHQDPWEMLITFLISQRKSIPASAPPWNTLPGAAANLSVPKAMKFSSSLPRSSSAASLRRS